jgi:poly(3-hydroxybutyrate) depolymerase
MVSIDWRELYASNRAVIERAGGAPGELRTGVGVPGELDAWQERTFTVAGQTRRALVRPPAGVEPQTAVPLVCLLHGCTQDAASFAAATLMNDAADRHGFVAGLSAGGAMAAILAAAYPDLLAAVAVHSGLAYRSAASMGAAFTAMARGAEDPIAQGRAAHAAMGDLARPVPSMVIHGTADRTVAPVNADQVLEQSMTANRLAAPATCDLDIARPTTTSRGQVDGGHAYTRCQWTDRRGVLMHELLTVDGLGHAWSGGAPGGSYTDPRGPDATEAIWRFFAQATADQSEG